MIQNPWNKITIEKKILDIDKDSVERHNHQYTSKEDRKISTIDYPEPFIGNPNASIYILLANPGRDLRKENSTLQYIEDNGLEKTILKNLNHDFSDVAYPFYFLDPDFQDHPGAKWWRKVFCKFIKNDTEIQQSIANEIFGVELYGYHSAKCERRLLQDNSDKLISVDYSYELVRQAIAENKIILLARAVGAWFKKVPELKKYDNCHFVASNRGIEFSNRTISPKAYLEIEKIISMNS